MRLWCIKNYFVRRSADCGWRALHPERRGAGPLLRQARHSRRGEVLQGLRGEQHRGEVLVSLVEGRMRGKVFGLNKNEEKLSRVFRVKKHEEKFLQSLYKNE
jgi:hypothetical protein